MSVNKLLQQKIQLADTDCERLPQTFEEWCAIHGEPEYVGQAQPVAKSEIVIEDCTHDEDEDIDTSCIITVDKNGNQRLDYKKFVDVFAKVNNCVFCNGAFYNPEGEISAQTIRRDIANSLGDMSWRSRLDVPTNSLFTTLKDMYSVEQLPVSDKVIPLANGDLHIGETPWVFRLNEKKHSPYRMSVSYTPVSKPMPLFNKWLTDVFSPEDINTVQDIMGYCLVPSTAAGEAFIVVGDGEAGKSGIGAIIMGLLGNAAMSMETQDLVSKRFQIAGVENKLVAYDDDLGSAALVDTNLFKKLITADTPIRGERKYADPHEFLSYCRIVASANFMLSSLYDDSDGFFRRLHPIHVKPKPKGRKVIRKFYETILAEEKEQILRWALVGLKRVIANGWQITWSQRSRDYMTATKSAANYFEDFFNETCEVTTDGSTVTTREMCSLHRTWCRENGIKDRSDRRLTTWLSDGTDRWNISYSGYILRSGKRVRGYKNVKIKEAWRNVIAF